MGALPVSEDQLPEDAKKRLMELREEQKSLEASLPVEPTAMGVKEGTAEKARINIRGSHLTLGRPVRGVFRGAGVERTTGDSGTGKRTSAVRRLARQSSESADGSSHGQPDVEVHFGRGLVASTDNFGLLGEKPTHPELLDWLASEFIRSGWSLKSMHRLMLLSRTWQLSNSDDNSAARNGPCKHIAVEVLNAPPRSRGPP